MSMQALAIVGENVVVTKNTVIGDNEDIVVIGAGEVVKSNAVKQFGILGVFENIQILETFGNLLKEFKF